MKQLSFFFLCLTTLMPFGDIQSQSATLEAFVKSPNLKYAGVGVCVVDLEKEKEVCSYNANQSLRPASTLKLLTTASALELLGEDFVYKTTIFTDGVIDQEGILKGNLYVQGSGDPTLGSEYLGDGKESFMKQWVDALKKAGIKHIDGAVISLDGLFGYEGISNKWLWEDIGNYYASGTYGISVFDNTYRLYLSSTKVGTKPRVLYTEPFVPSLQFESGLTVSNSNMDSAYIYGIPFSSDRRIFGSIPANKEAFMIKGDLPDPGLFLAQTFTDYLKQNGLPVSKEPTTSRLTKEENPVQSKVLDVTVSNPLSEIIRTINVKSNNHYAEHVFRTLAVGKNPRIEVKNYWKTKGIDTDGLFIYDGCGLSTVDAIPVSVLTQLLVYMNNKSKYADAFYKSLPLVGSEGTVASFLKGSALDGKVKAKSGSLSKVLCYAGYINYGKKRYAFSVIINNFTGTQALVKKQIETLLLGLFDDSKTNI